MKFDRPDSIPASLKPLLKNYKDELNVVAVSELAKKGVIFVEDGNHGENRPLQHEFVDVGVRFIRPPDLKDGRVDFENADCINEKAFNRVRKGIGKAGDIILTHRATVGRVAITEQFDPHVFVTNPGTTVWRSLNEKVLDQQYLYCYMRSVAFMDQLWANVGNNCTFDYVSLTQQRALLVAFPDVEKQREIASQIRVVDKKIELNRQINHTLELIAQAIFKSWFVDFEPVKAKTEAKAENRDPEHAAMCAISGKAHAELDQIPRKQLDQIASTAALFPDEMEDEIPKGWETRKVEAILTRLSARVRYTKDQVKPDGSIPVFEQGAGILLGYHDGSAQFQATPEDPAFIFGDHTCVTHLACEPFDISQNVIPLKGSDRPTAWVYYAVKDKQAFQEYRRHWMELVSKDVVVPPEPVCREFAKVILPLLLSMEANVRQSRTLATIRDAILPKLLSGELPLEAAQAIVEGNEV